MQGTWVLPWVGKIPWRWKRQPTPVFLFGKFQGQRMLVSYSPWGPKTIGQDLVTQWHQWTSCCCCSVIKLCPTLSNPMDCSTPGFPVLHYLPSLLKLMSTESVMPSNHLTLCFPLLLLPSVFPTNRVFLSQCIRWSKFWSFSFSISPSKWIFRVDIL